MTWRFSLHCFMGVYESSVGVSWEGLNSSLFPFFQVLHPYLSALVDLTRVDTMFGLSERIIATESLWVEILVFFLLFGKHFGAIAFHNCSAVSKYFYVGELVPFNFSLSALQLSWACGMDMSTTSSRVLTITDKLIVMYWSSCSVYYLCFRVFLAGQFESLHAHLEAMIPANKRAFLSQFYSQVRSESLHNWEFERWLDTENLIKFVLIPIQTVSTSQELRRPVYRSVASRVIDYDQVGSMLELNSFYRRTVPVILHPMFPGSCNSPM